jgi:DNA repair protein RadD
MSLFPPPPLAGGLITPRPYQEEAFEALDLHISTKDSNPCVVLPTGSGKSIVIAWTIQKWKAAYQPLRVCILAHRKELVKQNHDELVDVWPAGDIGIYAAGLGRKDEEHSVIYASIDSIYNKWGNFAPFDIIIVDEAHRIPAKGEGKYREFIKGCRISNKNLRVIGFTATPYRMGCGPICHKDHILNEVCYEANVGDLIAQGFLCKLRSKMGDVQPDLTNVKRNSGGDYIESSLAAAIDTDDLVSRTIKSVMETLIRERRKSVLFFCVDMDHCKRVSVELRKYGVDAPYVTAKTPHHERDRISEGFKTGRYKALCSINVFSEGFNAKRVDAVVLLRPTLSVGLYYQQVGRGLRLHDSKTDCLILDYAHCIQEHGPIDCIEAGEVKIIECGGCGDTFSRAIRVCPHCGWEIPKEEIERAEAVEREKKMHEEKASQAAILGMQPEDVEVSDVACHRHSKPGAFDSIRVEYRCGLSSYREWICLDHGGFAEKKARRWWGERFGWEEAKTVTVDSALQDMLLGQRIKDVTKQITIVRRDKKYHDIVQYVLNKGITTK